MISIFWHAPRRVPSFALHALEEGKRRYFEEPFARSCSMALPGCARRPGTRNRSQHKGRRRLSARLAPLSSRRTYPCAEVAPPSFAAFVVILATSTTASINGSVVGMFEMPFVPNVEFAQQCLDHGSLRFESQCSVLLMMAFRPSLGNWHMLRDRRSTMISQPPQLCNGSGVHGRAAVGLSS
jgi:hypothetical protein